MGFVLLLPASELGKIVTGAGSIGSHGHGNLSNGTLGRGRVLGQKDQDEEEGFTSDKMTMRNRGLSGQGFGDSVL